MIASSLVSSLIGCSLKFPVIQSSLGSSVIDSSSGSSLIVSSLGYSVLFFRYVAIFYRKNVLLSLLKTDILFCGVFSKKPLPLTISLRCFNDANKTSSEKHEEILV